MVVCSIPLLSALFSACLPPAPLATGYVEGQAVLIAPVVTTQVGDLSVSRGDHVTAGAVLVTMQQRDAEIALAQARATLAQAVAELDNLGQGLRPEEIAVIEATLASARAQADEYTKERDRLAALVERGAATQAALDAAQTQLTVAQAKVGEAEANLAVARLPARDQQIAAATAAVAQATAGVEAAEWQLDQRLLHAPVDGLIEEVLLQSGEIAGPQVPVLSLLPDGAVVVRLFVPETEVATIGVGTRLSVSCDGCSDTIATITYVAATPEFTPPVIYSLENRQKLVYMVEARPDDAAGLKPGQIVDADLAAPQ